MLWEQTIIIESKKEQTFVINNDNLGELINTREECKIKIKQSYLGCKNIQLAGYTHSIKTRVTQLKDHICSENTHSNYRTSDNYSNNNCNCNYKNYREYHKRRMKTRTAVHVSSLNQINESEQGVSKEKRRGDSVWPTGRMKFSPYKQVDHAVNTHNNETGMQDGSGTQWRLCYKGTMYFLYTTNNC